MKKTLYLVVALTVLCVVPIYAQGAFTDVPAEHWAYDAVQTLQSKGIVQGYPDGTFQGKRTMSRYELATVIARLLQQIPTPPTVDTSNLVTKDELASAIAAIPKPAAAPAIDLSKYATKDDLAAISKLVDGFKDELQALGVDVDQVKRDLAALTARVDAIETELKRVRFTGVLNVAAKTYADNTTHANFVATGAQLIDIDGRSPSTLPVAGSSVLRNIQVYRDFDLNIVGRVNETTTANATINFGNYISYLNTGMPGGVMDAFTPYYMNIASDLGFGQLTVGRFPLQLGAYTFKMPVADSYIDMAKTTSGDRPVDGAMLKMGLIGLDWTLFAAQHDKVPTYAGYAPFINIGPTAVSPSNVYGVPFTQSAGVRVGYNAPMGIRINGTYYQGWDRNNFKTSMPDILEVLGGDINIPIPLGKETALSVAWTKSTQKTLGVKVDDTDNRALDGRLSAGFGGLKVGVGYRNVGDEFVAPGAWDKIAFVNDPTNVKGYNGDLAYNFSDKLSVNVGGQFLKLRDTDGAVAGHTTFGVPGMVKDDKINQYKAGVNYAISAKDAIGLNAEWVVIDAKSRPSGFDKPTFSYVTLDWGRKLGENANLKVGYQLIQLDSGVPSGTSPSFKGQVGVVQLGVSF